MDMYICLDQGGRSYELQLANPGWLQRYIVRNQMVFPVVTGPMQSVGTFLQAGHRHWS